MGKLKFGFFSFTGDEGCMMIFIEILNKKYSEWENKIDFRYIKQLKSKNILKDLDYAFVEGAISTEDEVKRLKEVRNNSKSIIAIGSCAITGAPSNHRNFFAKKELNEIKPILKKFKYLDKVYPLSNFINVDHIIPGCPVSEELLTKFIDEAIKNA